LKTKNIVKKLYLIQKEIVKFPLIAMKGNRM